MNEKCFCGEPLHYKDKEVEDYMRKKVAELGEFIVITLTDGPSYRVPRHYIALHGIIGLDIERLGFERII